VPPSRPSAPRRFSHAFTILEITTAIVVIMILVTLLLPAYQVVRVRMEKASCATNLRQLYVGANAYLQEYGHWPQVNPALLQSPNNAYDEAWIEDFIPFGIGRATWICPTMERSLGAPDYTQPANYRADYIAMPYDSKTITPMTWPTQPWFAERGNVHGTGNLLILANGSVTDLYSISPAAAAAAAAGL
jgi:type II secretory pathway pseudopilin PulG